MHTCTQRASRLDIITKNIMDIKKTPFFFCHFDCLYFSSGTNQICVNLAAVAFRKVGVSVARDSGNKKYLFANCHVQTWLENVALNFL